MWAQAHMLAYEEIRQREECEERITMYKCMGAKMQ